MGRALGNEPLVTLSEMNSCVAYTFREASELSLVIFFTYTFRVERDYLPRSKHSKRHDWRGHWHSVNFRWPTEDRSIARMQPTTLGIFPTGKLTLYIIWSMRPLAARSDSSKLIFGGRQLFHPCQDRGRFRLSGATIGCAFRALGWWQGPLRPEQISPQGQYAGHATALRDITCSLLGYSRGNRPQWTEHISCHVSLNGLSNIHLTEFSLKFSQNTHCSRHCIGMERLTVSLTLLIAFSPSILASINGACTLPGGTSGVCLSTSSCGSGGGTSNPGFCPDDPDDMQCCTKTCSGSGGTGDCRSTSCPGTSLTGLCPGPADFKCCIYSSGGGGGGGGASSTKHDLSANGAKFIAGFEGFSADFYDDAAVSIRMGKVLVDNKYWSKSSYLQGVKTIGYGHACQPSSACDSINAPITEAQGQALLKSDAATFVACINKDVTVPVSIKDNLQIFLELMNRKAQPESIWCSCELRL